MYPPVFVTPVQQYINRGTYANSVEVEHSGVLKLATAHNYDLHPINYASCLTVESLTVQY